MNQASVNFFLDISAMKFDSAAIVPKIDFLCDFSNIHFKS
jgi:hypothetical protein